MKSMHPTSPSPGVADCCTHAAPSTQRALTEMPLSRAVLTSGICGRSINLSLCVPAAMAHSAFMHRTNQNPYTLGSSSGMHFHASAHCMALGVWFRVAGLLPGLCWPPSLCPSPCSTPYHISLHPQIDTVHMYTKNATQRGVVYTIRQPNCCSNPASLPSATKLTAMHGTGPEPLPAASRVLLRKAVRQTCTRGRPPPPSQHAPLQFSTISPVCVQRPSDAGRRAAPRLADLHRRPLPCLPPAVSGAARDRRGLLRHHRCLHAHP